MPRSNITLRNWCITNNVDLIQFLLNKADADNYSYSSHYKVYWECSKGHIFSRAIMNMTSRRKFTCTICSGKGILIGYNDLATTRPDLAEEWDYDKNDILPTEVTAGAFKDVWWKCKNNHSWKARISARDYRNGCPYCNGKSRTSLPEQIVYYYCKKYFPDTMNMYSINGVSYDIYIPSRKVVIEYDGSAWHSNKDTNYKFTVASKAGLTLYKISGVVEDLHYNVYTFNDRSLKVNVKDNVLVSILYKFLLEVFNINEDFSDYSKAYSFAVRQKSNIKSSIITLPDNIQFEWSPLNGYDFNYLSNDGLDKYWRCFYWHTFKRRLDVIKRGYVGCPFCENQQSFDFLYLGSVSNLSIILDVNTLEIEFLADSFIYHSFEVGLNIQGIKLYNDNLLFSVDYILSMKPTRFRNNFERFKNKYFICKDMNYSFIIDELNKIFNSSLSIEKVHLLLNKFLGRSERI